MSTEQDMNNEQSRLPNDSERMGEHNHPSESDRATMDSSPSQGTAFQQTSPSTEPDSSAYPQNTPKKDDSPQAAVKNETTENVESHDLPTSPMSVNKMAQAWFTQADLEDIQSRWTSIQIQFIDEPCSAVEQGEALVAETIERVKQMIADQQQSIGQQWLNHDNISTEDFRTTILKYRELLNRMLNL